MCMKDAIQNCKTSLLLNMQFTQYSSYSNGSNLHQTVFSGTINGGYIIISLFKVKLIMNCLKLALMSLVLCCSLNCEFQISVKLDVHLTIYGLEKSTVSIGCCFLSDKLLPQSPLNLQSDPPFTSMMLT